MNGTIGVLAILAALVLADRVRQLRAEDPAALGPFKVRDWQRYGSHGYRTGSTSAAVVITMFSDYQCPFCKAADSTLRDLQRGQPDVALVHRHFPLPFHPAALPAAKLAVCAEQRQEFERVNAALFLHQDSLGKSPWKRIAMESGVADVDGLLRCADASGGAAEQFARDTADGHRLKIIGTPVILVNGIRYNGWPGRDSIEKYVAAAKTR
ncbi:MAG: DsbA family protein [Gemmatimonadaceae bacterium]|nr:DsbA family protein [Gemmatimonadaceae bacterium]